MAGIAPLKSIILPAISKHTATVIFVHGLGDTGAGWEPVGDMFSSEMPHVKWIFPHSPMIPITANGGMKMPGWFDITSFGFDSGEDGAGMRKSEYQLNQIISGEVDAGIPANRVVLGGFSQGGAMTLLTGLSSERKLAGLAVLRLPFAAGDVAIQPSEYAKSLPIFWGQGQIDPLVRPELAIASARMVIEKTKTPEVKETANGKFAEFKGSLFEFKTYSNVAHSTSQQELNDLKEWLKKTLPEE
ncbi:Phospholipase/carboxylesterase [Roridomyces roridus]|uniref:Acyl-protein thioesterase 1 n=1 Tax=Roridomyces roridus TaxID=1738132 RepID=A0AAD7FVJ3_9AGAR|nr:Phospholipase/carboxylesterase [Roridomyces roridus]